MMMESQTARRLLLFSLSVFFVGCGGDPRRGSIEGEITVNGQPLESGTISFVPTAGNTGPVTGSAIVAGRYQVPHEKGPYLGPNRVEIRSLRPSGRMIPDIENPGGPPIPEIVQFIPAEYSDESTLEREVKRGKNTFDFPLEF